MFSYKSKIKEVYEIRSMKSDTEPEISKVQNQNLTNPLFKFWLY